MEKVDKQRKIYEGKAKIVYETGDPDLLIQYFKDDATAFDGKKRGVIPEKGIYNNRISAVLFIYLGHHGVPTHLVKLLSEREMLVKRLQIVPIEVVMRNIVAGSLAKRLGLEEGLPVEAPILEFYYKSDALGDPMINEYHIRALGLASPDELREIEELSFKANGVLLPFFEERGILLVDFKMEFGRHKGRLLLGDELSPDTCRFWDKRTLERMDKDRFRRDLGQVEKAYREIFDRIVS